MHECEIAAGELVEAAEDAAEVLHLAEQAFDSGALLVEAPVGLACRGAGRVGWDDRHGVLLGDPGEDGVAVIGAIGEHRFDRNHRDCGEQGYGRGRVAGLARCQGEPQRVAEAVGDAGLWGPRTPRGAVQLAGEPAP